jgi:uncharacterized oxidoreductase
MSGNAVLITGGGTGIGFCLAQALLNEGNAVLICGRREEKLREAQRRCPDLQIKVCDISNEEDRTSLAEWAIARGATILINNAGMQREVDFTRGLPALTEGDNEIRCNLEGPIFLTARLIPHLLRQKNAAIVNVSSALGFVPMAIMPVYCATKAAIHSFTLSLRHQLSRTGIKVFEVIPPTVNTELDRGARARRGQVDRGIPPEEVAAAVMKGMAEERLEIAVGMAANLVAGSKANFERLFQSLNARRPDDGGGAAVRR